MTPGRGGVGRRASEGRRSPGGVIERSGLPRRHVNCIPAPRDGTVFAITGRTAAIKLLLGNKNAKFDGRQFNWIGTANVEYTTCTLWHWQVSLSPGTNNSFAAGRRPRQRRTARMAQRSLATDCCAPINDVRPQEATQ